MCSGVPMSQSTAAGSSKQEGGAPTEPSSDQKCNTRSQEAAASSSRLPTKRRVGREQALTEG